jgi:chromosome segregation ATPase
MNGEVFLRLHQLKEVSLDSNPCINENFLTPTLIAVLQRTVRDRCGFNEPEVTRTVAASTKIAPATTTTQPTTTTVLIEDDRNDHEDLQEESASTISRLEAELKDSKSKIETLHENIEEITENFGNLNTELESLKLQIVDKNSESSESCIEQIEKLQTDLKWQEVFNNQTIHLVEDLKATIIELKFDKQQCQQQFNFIQELQQDLKTQWSESCDLKTELVRNNFETEKWRVIERIAKIESTTQPQE